MNKISNIQRVMESEIERSDVDIGIYKEQIFYYLNYISRFIDNGYESNTEKIKLGHWWEKRVFSFEKQIFFKKDYSARPSLFFTVNKLKYFSFNNVYEHKYQNALTIDVNKKKLMTSYFTVEVTITANDLVGEDEIIRQIDPYIEITYIAFNKS